MRFACQTTFDITATGIVGHYKGANVPFQDRAGQSITDIPSWNRARNQQRNWETLTQLIAMRAQIFDILNPVNYNGTWSFEFEVETPDVYGSQEDPVAVLRMDANGIPMLNNLDNTAELPSTLITTGPQQNIWFMPISINN
jgi:serine protease inhibitor